MGWTIQVLGVQHDDDDDDKIIVIIIINLA